MSSLESGVTRLAGVLEEERAEQEGRQSKAMRRTAAVRVFLIGLIIPKRRRKHGKKGSRPSGFLFKRKEGRG
jgi:hypothetical protein